MLFRGISYRRGVDSELIGRNQAIAFANEHLQAAEQSNGRGIVIAGEAGIGKSALIAAIGAQAANRGMVVRQCTGQLAEQQAPFGLLHHLLGSPKSQRPTTEQPTTEQPTAPQTLTSVANGVLTHLAAQSVEQPVLWIIDDLHWADESSATLLSFIARRLAADRVLLLFGLRTENSAAEHRTILDLRGFPRIELAPLSESQSAELLINEGCDPAIAVEHAALGGGLPLALVELAKQLNNGTATKQKVALHIPQHYANLVEALSANTLRVLSISALDDELRTILAVAGSGGVQYLGEAEDLDIIRVEGERVLYRHPSLRAAVLNAITPEDKRAIHRAIAVALSPHIDADRIALHLGRSAETPDDHAANALAEFGERARLRGGVSEAVMALERAAALAGTPEQQASFLLEAGKATYFAGDSQRGIEFAEQALQLAETVAVKAQANSLIANASMWERSPTETTERLLQVVESSKTEEPVLAAWALIGAGSMAFLKGSLQEGVEQSREAEVMGALTGDFTVSIAANAMVSWNLFLIGDKTESDARMQALEPFVGALMEAEVVEGLSFGQNWAMCLIMQERFAESELLLEKLLPVARKLSVDLAVAIITVLLANLRWRQGRWREAYSHSTLYALSPSLPAISTAWGSAAAASVAAALGNIEETERLAERAFENTPDGEVPLVRAWANAALGHLHLSQGQPAIALVHLRQTAQCVTEMELGQPLFFLWWGDYLEALIGVGEREEAQQLLTQLEQRNELLNLRWIEGICERTRGCLAPSVEEANARFTQSIIALSTCPYPFEVARTKLQWARYQARNTNRSTPTNELQLLNEAITEFHRLDATVWEAAAQSLRHAEFGPANTEHKPVITLNRNDPERNDRQEQDPLQQQRLEEVLSEAELRVALVVAAGRSNREVAIDLYLSVRTVEFHLSAIFRKLGLKNRNALIRLVQTG